MIVFVLLALVALVTAILAVRASKLTYAALWLAGTLIAIAALFLSLGAEFLALVQVLIYAGAVITLILFAIMFAQEESPS